MRWLGLWVVVFAPMVLAQEVKPNVEVASKATPKVELRTSADVPSEDGSPEFLEQYRDAAIERWEKTIGQLEASDKVDQDPDDAILFIGSSSIRRWQDIAIDMSPFRTIQRGYGGSKYSDVAIFAPRILRPHQYRALVIFVGNDVSGKPGDHSPDQVEELARYVVRVSQQHQPDAPVFLIEVTPTASRFAAWPKIRKVNERLREIALSTPRTHFIATAEHFLDPEGNPRNEFFVEDKLHLNESGYHLWATLIRRRLEETFRASEEFHAKAAALEEAKSNDAAAVSR